MNPETFSQLAPYLGGAALGGIIGIIVAVWLTFLTIAAFIFGIGGGALVAWYATAYAAKGFPRIVEDLSNRFAVTQARAVEADRIRRRAGRETDDPERDGPAYEPDETAGVGWNIDDIRRKAEAEGQLPESPATTSAVGGMK